MKLLQVGIRQLVGRSNYCFDTHPLVWYFTGQKILSLKAKKILDEVFTQKATGFISSIVLLEIFHFGLKKRKFIFSQFLKTIRLPNIIIVPLDKVILTKCFTLPRYLEIHDRVIAATALVNNSILVTKDRELKKVPRVRTIW